MKGAFKINASSGTVRVLIHISCRSSIPTCWRLSSGCQKEVAHTHRYPLLSHCLISAVGRQLKLVPAGGILPGKCWLPASHCSGGPPPAFTHQATSIRSQKINAAIQSHLPILRRLCMCECRPLISTQSHTVLNKSSQEQEES